ncbi:MAG TPA: ArsA family ATPase [Pseudonocardia sp.]|uniref:ArsA family ATPase n=1 Tax=Pseudonocardia sp. TaxID=60912 RepID=UPI002C811659|nr:ArsA family ATPase [Pseudonocardia sp.]HTF47330.1 ArsA family ATPase [Pseudonocardia sp.]
MRILLFTGKGGVGKTTLAAATAARLARSGRKALVISTDPAHSLGDALDADLGGDPLEVDPGLFAAHLDGRALVEGAWNELRGHLRTVLAGAGVDELVADELTWLPGVDELLALGEVRRLAQTGPWEVVIVDCGPTAETLRLLGLPEAIGGYLERLYPAHRRAVRGLLAGIAGASPPRPGTPRNVLRNWDEAADALGRLAEQVAALRAMLADHHSTSIRLVLTPERLVAAESRRTMTALALHGLRVDGIIANRVVPPIAPSVRGPAARWVRARRAEQQEVLGELSALWGNGHNAAECRRPVRAVPYTAAEPIGVTALLELADALYGDEEPLAGADAPPLLSVRRTEGDGTDPDSEFELALRLPGLDRKTPLELTRIDDDLAVTVGGVRRLVALPSVLSRCEVLGARVGTDELIVVFRPDPAVWMTR